MELPRHLRKFLIEKLARDFCVKMVAIVLRVPASVIASVVIARLPQKAPPTNAEGSAMIDDILADILKEPNLMAGE